MKMSPDCAFTLVKHSFFVRTLAPINNECFHPPKPYARPALCKVRVQVATISQNKTGQYSRGHEIDQTYDFKRRPKV